MFDSLSPSQRRIAFDLTGRSVVRACPGSGKTYSVAARLAYRLQQWKSQNQGVAALSFTNVAWVEIQEKLKKNFQRPVPLYYPHFLGTLDSFINKYIFLPHGHLIMRCPGRPSLVGQPHGPWNIKAWERDYAQYFDIVSYDANDNLIYPEIQKTFFFSYSQIIKTDGTESEHAKSLRTIKQRYWRQGYANQHDANYFALRVLQRFPMVASSLVQRFPELIIDEAQDTSDIQMRILDILCEAGLQELILVGDPDQAIFEWNNAQPHLFTGKYNLWRENSVILNENRRSSQLICNSTYQLSTLEHPSTAIDPAVQELTYAPEVISCDLDHPAQVISGFLDSCRQKGIIINRRNIAVLCRSRSFIGTLSGHSGSIFDPWTDDRVITYSLLHAKYLYDHGSYREAFRLCETLLYRAVSGNTEQVKRSQVDDFIKKGDYLASRYEIYRLLASLPVSTGKLQDWIYLANRQSYVNKYYWPLTFIREAGERTIEELFQPTEDDLSTLNYTLDTIHGVKGETFEAVLIFLRTKGIGKNYTTLINAKTVISDNEELRIVYVGITRPRQYLMLAVPNDVNKAAWENVLLSDTYR